MKPTLRQFEAFLLVYRLRSLTKAAAELRITQSAMSLLLRQLEQTLGTRLFDRTTRALSPTSAGIEMVPIAGRILAETDGLVAHMQNLLDAKAGRVCVAVSAGAASAVLPPIFARFRRRYPQVTVELLDVTADQLLDVVVGGKAEVGIGSVDEGDALGATVELLLRSPLCAIGRRDGRFERRRGITWNEISAWETIAMREGTRIRSQIDRALMRAGKVLRPTMEVSLISTALAITAQGGGVSILPAHLLPAKQFPSLAAVPLTAPQISRQVSLVTRAGMSLSPAARRFVAVAKAHVEAK